MSSGNESSVKASVGVGSAVPVPTSTSTAYNLVNPAGNKPDEPVPELVPATTPVVEPKSSPNAPVGPKRPPIPRKQHAPQSPTRFSDTRSPTPTSVRSRSPVAAPRDDDNASMDTAFALEMERIRASKSVQDERKWEQEKLAASRKRDSRTTVTPNGSSRPVGGPAPGPKKGPPTGRPKPSDDSALVARIRQMILSETKQQNAQQPRQAQRVPEVCRHYLEGRCSRDPCRFLHPAANPPAAPRDGLGQVAVAPVQQPPPQPVRAPAPAGPAPANHAVINHDQGGYEGVDRRGEVPDNVPLVRVGYALRPNEITWIRKNLNVQPVSSEHGLQAHHPHPVTAVERKIVRMTIMDHIRREYPGCGVVDFMGNPVYHMEERARRDGYPQVQCWSPPLVSSQAVELAKLRDQDNFCTCTIEPMGRPEAGQVAPCAHTTAFIDRCERTVAMSIHGAYYLHPSAIARLCAAVSTHTFIAAIYMFPDAIGAYNCGEVKYHVCRDENVDVMLGGDKWRHSAMHWITRKFCDAGLGDGRTLVWSHIGTVGSTYLYCFTLLDRVMVQEDMSTVSFERLLAETDYWGPALAFNISLPSANLGTDGEFHSFLAYSLGLHVGYSSSEHGPIVAVFPREILQKCITWLAGRPRNATSFAEFRAYVKMLMSRVNVPVGQPLEALPSFISWLFNRDVGHENKALDQAHSTFVSWMLKSAEGVLPPWGVNQLSHAVAYDARTQALYAAGGFIAVGAMALFYRQLWKERDSTWRFMPDRLSLAGAIRNAWHWFTDDWPDLSDAPKTAWSWLTDDMPQVNLPTQTPFRAGLSEKARVAWANFRGVPLYIEGRLANYPWIQSKLKLTREQVAALSPGEIMLFLRNERVTLASFGLDVVIVPVVEEHLKRHVVAWWALSIFESWFYGDTVFQSISRALLHFVLTMLPVHWAIGLHSLWNALWFVRMWRAQNAVDAIKLSCGPAIFVGLLALLWRSIRPQSFVRNSVASFNETGACPLIDESTVEVEPLFELANRKSTQPIGPLDINASIDVLETTESKMQGPRCMGWGIAGAFPTNFKPGFEDEVRAIANRCLFPLVEPDPVVLGLFRSAMLRLVDGVVVQPVSFEEWNSRYPSARQREDHERALHMWNGVVHPRHRGIKAFGKNELLPLSFGPFVADKSKRLIQGNHAPYNVVVGPAMLAASKALATTYDPASRVCYANGITSEQMGVWFAAALNRTTPQWRNEVTTELIPFDGVHGSHLANTQATIKKQRLHCDLEPDQIIETLYSEKVCCAVFDFSNYDGSQHSLLTEVELEAYLAMGVDPYVVSIERDQSRRFRGGTPHGVFFSGTGRRKSGDPTTSVGNTLIAMSFFSSVLRYGELQFGIKRESSWLIALGDDTLLVFHDERVLDLPWKWFADHLGMSIKIKFVTPARADFCSSLPYPAVDGLVFGPKLFRFLGKTGFSLCNSLDWKAHIAGVALGLDNNLGWVPIARHLFAKAKALTNRHHEHRDDMYKLRAVQPHRPHDSIYEFLALVYGVPAEVFSHLDEIAAQAELPFLFGGYWPVYCCALDNGRDFPKGSTSQVVWRPPPFVMLLLQNTRIAASYFATMPPKKRTVKVVKPKAAKPKKKVVKDAPTVEIVELKDKPKRVGIKPKKASIDPGALAFANSALNPFDSAPVRYPDPLPQGTGVCTEHWRYVVPVVTDTVSGAFLWGVVLYPRPDNMVISISAAASGALTWAHLTDSRNLSQLVATTLRYRVLRIGGRIRNFTNRLNQGGEIFCGTISSVSSTTTVTLPTTEDLITGNPSLRVVSGAENNLPAKTICRWMPIDETGYQMRLPADAASPDDQSTTNASALLWYGTAVSAADKIELELVVSMEYLPLDTVTFSEIRTNVGEFMDVAKVFEASGARKSGVSGVPDAQSWYDKAAKWLSRQRRVIEASQTIFDWVGGALGSMGFHSTRRSLAHQQFALDVAMARAAFHEDQKTDIPTRHRKWLASVRAARDRFETSAPTCGKMPWEDDQPREIGEELPEIVTAPTEAIRRSRK